MAGVEKMKGIVCSAGGFGWAGAGLLAVLGGAALDCSAAPGSGSKAQPIDYAEPRLLIGRICPMGPEPRKCLFVSQRQSECTGATVRVTFDYNYPNGLLAARDRIVYEAGRLASYDEEELQTGERGSATIRPDPKNPGKWRIYFEYTTGLGVAAKKTSDSEALQNDTLVDDMILGFIESHWDTLQEGLPAKFRFIVLSRKETVGFKLIKAAETKRLGKPVVLLKMEPTSFIIAQLVDPLIFVVEKAGAHRILEYIGRTTPRIKTGTKWKVLDAATVFDWKQEIAETGAGPAPSGPR